MEKQENEFQQRYKKILIVGLGVIGGGYASALTNAGYSVSCITKDQSDIDYALERGMINYGTTIPAFCFSHTGLTTE